MFLHKKLNNWLALNLINEEQYKKIIQHEQHQSAAPSLFQGLICTGIGIVGLGIIAIIAANWVLIPNSIKLIGDFSLLIFTGILINYFYARPLKFEGMLFFFAILCLASIGLISQIYQTHGSFYQAILFWSAITLPLILLSKKAVLPTCWVWATGLSILQYIDLQFMLPAFHLLNISLLLSLSAIIISLTILYFKKITIPIAKSLIQFGIITLYFNIFLMSINRELDLPLICNNLFTNQCVFPSFNLTQIAILALIIILLSAVIFTRWPRFEKFLLLIAGIVGLIQLSFFYSAFTLSPIANFIGCIIMLITLTLFFGLRHLTFFYRLGLFIITLRLLWLYWDLFNNLLFTGLVIIITGLVLILLARLINALKPKLLTKLGYSHDPFLNRE